MDQGRKESGDYPNDVKQSFRQKQNTPKGNENAQSMGRSHQTVRSQTSTKYVESDTFRKEESVQHRSPDHTGTKPSPQSKDLPHFQKPRTKSSDASDKESRLSLRTEDRHESPTPAPDPNADRLPTKTTSIDRQAENPQPGACDPLTSAVDKRINSSHALSLNVRNGIKSLPTPPSRPSRVFDSECSRTPSNVSYHVKEVIPTVSEPRAVLYCGPEPCSCYPWTSSPRISSMVYEQIRCIHHGQRGCPHEGVIGFDDGWNTAFELSTTPRTREQEKTQFVPGYPKPEMELIESRTSSHISNALQPASRENTEQISKRSEGGSSLQNHEDRAGFNHTDRVRQSSCLWTVVNADTNAQGGRLDCDINVVDESLLFKTENNVHTSFFKTKGVSSEDNDRNATRYGSSQPIGDIGCRQNVSGQGNLSKVNKITNTVGSVVSLTFSQKWTQKLPETPEGKPTTRDFKMLNLPNIGYSPVPGNQKSPLSHEDQDCTIRTPRGELPETNMSNLTEDSFRRQTSESLNTRHSQHPAQTLGAQADFSSQSIQIAATPRDRTFQGKYYDPSDGHVYTYRVVHEFGKHINRWSTQREKWRDVDMNN